jgi:PAS domain S-box-containing protein
MHSSSLDAGFRGDGVVIQALYVDDDPLLLDLAKEFLEGENEDLSVTTCTSAREVLTLLKSKPFDVIISDYQMPTMSGIDLLKELRSHGIDIPFILFTGKGREEVVIDALNNGADFYLNKGGNPRVQFTELENLVRHMVLKRQAIDAVKHNAERFRAMIENSLDIICITNTESAMRYVSPSARKVLGYPPETLVGVHMEELVFPADKAMFHTILREGAVGISDMAEFRVRRADGSYTHFEGSFSKMKDDEGKAYVVFNGREISQRLLAEERMKGSDERYRLLFENVPAGIALFKDGVVDCNNHVAEMLGRTIKEIIGKKPWELAPERQRDGTRSEDLFRSVTAKGKIGQSTCFECVLSHKDGRPIEVRITLKPASIQGEQLILATFTELACQVDTEMVDLTEETCNALLNLTPDAILICDNAGKVSFASPHSSTLLIGDPSSKIIGRSLADMFPETERTRLGKDLEAIANGLAPSNMRYNVSSPTGQRYVEVMATPILDQRRRPQGCVCLFRDVTEGVMSDSAVIAANDKVEEMSGLMSDELAKRLAALVGDLQLLSFRSRDPEVKQHVERAIGQAAQIDHYLTVARTFRGVGTRPQTWFSLSVVCQAALSKVDLKGASFDAEMDDIEVLADPAFGNALEHLFQSQIERSPRTKHIRVRTESLEAGTLILVEDDGSGYEVMDKQRIFDADNGGFGLRFVKEVMHASHMRIEEKGEPDRGARFVITLPTDQVRPVR